MKKHRFSPQVPINFLLGFYSQLFLIMTALLLVMILPLLRQPIPLHKLTAIKTGTSILAPIVITIHREGQYELNAKHHSNRLLSPDAMKSILKQQLRVMDPLEVSVCLRVHPHTTYEHISEITEWLNSLNIQHVGFLHEKSE